MARFALSCIRPPFLLMTGLDFSRRSFSQATIADLLELEFRVLIENDSVE